MNKYSINALHNSTNFVIIVIIEYQEIEVGPTRVDKMRYERYRRFLLKGDGPEGWICSVIHTWFQD